MFDLSELSFMDSAGFAVLLGGARRVPLVRLRDPTPAVRRVVEVTGLTTVLGLGDDDGRARVSLQARVGHRRAAIRA